MDKTKVNLQDSNPNLYAQLHPTRNAEEGIRTDDLTSGMHRNVWWQCELGHQWIAIVYSRLKNKGCGVCSGTQVQTGVNDLATVYPELLEEWHPDKNDDLLPSEIYKHSTKKVWWRCKHEHEWKTAVVKRTVRGSNCPVCTNRIVVPGFNDLASVKPEIANQWHPSLNGELTPQMVTVGANRKAWWVCDEGHDYYAFINARPGCGICFGQKLLTGYNDLQTKFPEVALEWHPWKNSPLTPDAVLSGSHKSVWWQCKDGHEWKTTISSRTHAGRGCKFCDGQAAVPGVTDLETLNPVVASQWHPDKNGVLLPSMVTVGSNQKVWWLCEEGHEWATTVNSRNSGRGCRICKRTGTSKTEVKWYETLLINIPDLLHNVKIPVSWKENDDMSVDMISYEQNLVIEYDGWFYHSGERSGKDLDWHLAHDALKTIKLLDAGYRVIRIREGILPHLDIKNERLYQVSCKKNGKIDNIVDTLIKFI